MNLRKKSFNHIDKIIWESDVENKELTSIADFMDYVKYNCSNYPENNLEDYQKSRIIGICEMQELKEYLYIIIDPLKNICISIGRSHPWFWYKFNKKQFMKNFGDIYEKYNTQNYSLDFNKNTRGFTGTEILLRLSIEDIENHLILNSYSDKLLWGSKWSDHPFRKEYIHRNVSHGESIIYTGQAMRQLTDDFYSVSVRSIFSKSIITIENYDDSFIINISYDSFNSPQIDNVNNIFQREYPTDVPIDALLMIVNFPFITHIGLLKRKPVTRHQLMMASLVANNTKMWNDLIPFLKEENDELAKSFLETIEINKIIDSLLFDEELIEMIDTTEKENITEFIEKKYKCVYNDEIDRTIEHLLRVNKKLKN